MCFLLLAVTCGATINRKHCCVLMAMLSLCVILLTETYVKNTKDFHGNYYYADAPQCYIVHTLPIYFFLCTRIPRRWRHRCLQGFAAYL